MLLNGKSLLWDDVHQVQMEELQIKGCSLTSLQPLSEQQQIKTGVLLYMSIIYLWHLELQYVATAAEADQNMARITQIDEGREISEWCASVCLVLTAVKLLHYQIVNSLFL